MKVTCGTDIIEVERIQESIETLGKKFVEKIFTKNEIKYCIDKNKMIYQHFAARFAAKEAVYKAISSYIEEKYDIAWKNIEIVNNKNGRPIVNILEKDELKDKIENIDISLSHIKEYAIANCVVLFK